MILNPALPEARNYIAAICREIISGYDVDGLHLDYTRFVTDESGAGLDQNISGGRVISPKIPRPMTTKQAATIPARMSTIRMTGTGADPEAVSCMAPSTQRAVSVSKPY